MPAPSAPEDAAGGGFEEPGPDCPLCPRLVAYRRANRERHPDFHNAPVPSFGSTRAQLLIVGLAPGLKGANRTGRPFTGDYAGELLYPTLKGHGLARGDYRARADDDFELVDCRVTNALRCVPPDNKPESSEVATCRRFLAAELGAMAELRGVLALGAVAHDAVLAALGLVRSRYRFAHAAEHELANGLWLADSYHCSRYNTNTGRLTPEMFAAVVARVASRLA